MTNSIIHPDGVHRLVKEALDSGAVSSLDEAERLFAGYRLAFRIDATATDSWAYQAALLSGVALASRVFLGGVQVVGAIDVPLLVPVVASAATLAEAVHYLGGTMVADAPTAVPMVSIGGPARPPRHAFEVRLAFAGWSGGSVPVDTEVDAGVERRAMPLAAMLAAALAVNEAFIHIRGESAMAGRRRAGLSLWQPDAQGDWLAAGVGGPELTFLPSKVWMLGLGHLGQAFLWALGLLPYSENSGVELVLQDVDIVTPSTPSTSILSRPTHVGRRKSRVVADWCERRGFTTALHERFFDGAFRRQEEESTVALCGFDNPAARRALDFAGFGYVIEAGLGSGYRDFRAIRTHTLPGPRSAGELWPTTADVQAVNRMQPAYQDLVRRGSLDQCGATLLAGKSVGAPFVGAVTACLVVTELLRKLHNGPEYEVADLDLMDLDYRSLVSRSTPSPVPNPGYVRAARVP